MSALAVAAGVAIAAAFFLPVWWVSLTAPNYPADAFPDGIRLHFGFRGVVSGCTTAPATSRVARETQQEDLGWRSDEGTAGPASSAIDCVHEMNTINHYVGMHPIGFGAPVERLLSRYIVAMFGVMLLGFAVGSVRARAVVLGVGFLAVLGWMVVELYLAGALDAFVRQYQEDAGRYFREAERIARWGEVLRGWVAGTVGFLAAAMAASWWASLRWTRFQLVLAAVPALLPAFFVAAYGGWLWYFGHSLHPWGAFTLKPFMPTVFGEGKVAQFTTHSYPHLGFGVLCLASLGLVIALAWRRVELAEPGEDGATASSSRPAASKAA